MSIYQLKPRFQQLLRPLVGRLARVGVTPNRVTLAGLAVSMAAALALAAAPQSTAALLTVPLALFLRMALNAIDGMLAREHHMQTVTGAFLNEWCDVLSDCVLFLPLVLVLPQAAHWVLAFTLTAVLTELAGILAQALGGGRRYEGPMGKSDRAFLVGLLALLLGLGLAPGFWCTVLLAGGTLLGGWTAVRRTHAGIGQAKAASHPEHRGEGQ